MHEMFDLISMATYHKQPFPLGLHSLNQTTVLLHTSEAVPALRLYYVAILQQCKAQKNLDRHWYFLGGPHT